MAFLLSLSVATDDLEVSEEAPIDDRGRPAEEGQQGRAADDGVATQKKTRKVDRATEERERERRRKLKTSNDPRMMQRQRDNDSDSDRYTWVARQIRLAVSPYLPPPVVNGMVRHTDPFLHPYVGEEGTVKVAMSVLVAYVTMRVVQLVASRLLGKGRAVQDDNDDHHDGAASNRDRDEYDQTVVICGPSSSGKTRLLYHLCYNETVDTVASIKVNVIISDRTRYMDWPGTAKLNSDGFRSIVRNRHPPPLVVVVVDSTQAVAAAADCLHQLFSLLHNSSSSSSAEPVKVLVLCHKSDLPTAKNPKRVQLQLRGELERLLKSSAAKDATGTAVNQGGGSAVQWWSVGEPVDFDALKFAKLLFRSTSCEGKGCRDLVSEFVQTGTLAD